MTTRSSAMSTALVGGGGRRRPGRTLPASLLAVPVLTALLAGCSAEPALPAVERTAGAEVGAVRVASDGVQEVTLETGDDYVFTPDTFTVAPGEQQMTHNLLFTEGEGPAAIAEQIPVLGPQQSETIEFTVTEPGDYSLRVQLPPGAGAGRHHDGELPGMTARGAVRLVVERGR